MLDYHVHLLSHSKQIVITKEHIRTYLDQARKMNIRQVGFADHDMYWDHLNLNLIREVAVEYPDLQVRVGLEVDWIEGTEKHIRKLLDSFPFDYAIGSVHQLGGWFFDYPEEKENHLKRNADELYLEYFKAVEKVASSGLFQSIGHFDLIKLFGIRPQTDVRKLAIGALKAIKDHGLVIEINTNGRYKPVGEFYPEPKLIETIHAMGIPFTLSSDAHESGVVGRDIREVCDYLKLIGVNEVVGFRDRQKEIIPLI